VERCFGYSHSEKDNCLLWFEPLSPSKFQVNEEGWKGCWIPKESAGGATPKYDKISQGRLDVKCASVSGEDPKFKYVENKDKNECGNRCTKYTVEKCYGYSHSDKWNNCLLWFEPLSPSKFQENMKGWQGCWIST